MANFKSVVLFLKIISLFIVQINFGNIKYDYVQKIRLVNIQIKYVVGEMNNNNITYVDPDHTWSTSGGILNMNLYDRDNLHLVEKGNEKLAKTTTAFNDDLKTAAKSSRNWPTVSTGMPTTTAETPLSTTRRPATSRRVPKTSKRTTKAKTKTPATSNRMSTASRKNPETGRTTAISATMQTA